jgi:hypothetical protein
MAGPTRMNIMDFSRDSGAPQPGAFICVMGDRHIFRINSCGALQPAAAACSSDRRFSRTAWLALAALFSLRLREPCDRGRRERLTARLPNKNFVIIVIITIVIVIVIIIIIIIVIVIIIIISSFSLFTC